MAGGYERSAVTDDEPDFTQMKREELMALVNGMRNPRNTDVVCEETRHNDLHPTG